MKRILILSYLFIFYGAVFGQASELIPHPTDAATWTPASLPDLIMWLDADVGVTTETGVSLWTDQSGTGHHVSQGTGSLQPALNVADAAFGGKNNVQGDDVDDWLDFAINPTLTDYSVVSVVRGTGYYIGNDFSSVHYLSHATTQDIMRSSTTNTFTTSSDLSEPMIIEIYRTGTAVNLYEDGTASSSNPLVNATAWTPRALMRRTTTYDDIKIGTIIICTSELSAADKLLLRTYLANKYGKTL